MMNPNLSVDRRELASFCERRQIRKLAFFGSVLRDDFGPESDVDVLVEFHAEAQVGLFAMAALERELSGIIGRRVDLRTPADLSRYFRQTVLDEAEVQFAAAG